MASLLLLFYLSININFEKKSFDFWKSEKWRGFWKSEKKRIRLLDRKKGDPTIPKF